MVRFARLAFTARRGPSAGGGRALGGLARPVLGWAGLGWLSWAVAG